MALHFLFQVYIYSVVIAFFLQGKANGQCDQRSTKGELKCCKGRDSQCFVYHKRSNLTIARKVCYCDEYCKITKDCCPDYDNIKTLCGVGQVDCRVSQWTEWTGCSSECGFGIMKRKRYIVQLPKNDGAKCPPVRQVRGCFLSKCKTKSETALILPETYRRLPFGSWGYEKILPAPEELPQNDDVAGSYCVHFKPMMKRPSCGKTWADAMKSAQPVCVECQARVMDRFDRCRGDGQEGQRTRWVAVGLKRCYGEWIRVGPAIPNCTCTQSIFSNFVFV